MTDTELEICIRNDHLEIRPRQAWSRKGLRTLADLLLDAIAEICMKCLHPLAKDGECWYCMAHDPERACTSCKAKSVEFEDDPNRRPYSYCAACRATYAVANRERRKRMREREEETEETESDSESDE